MKAAIFLLALLITPSVNAADVSVWFSPHGGCTDEVVHEIGRAQKTILVQAYSFTSAPIAQALVEAKQRTVDVRLVVDKGQVTAHDTLAGWAAGKGIPTWVDHKHAIAHSKTMTIDSVRIITGSFNFTKAAEASNLENMLLIEDKALAAKYEANWNEHCAHSERWPRKN